jgi:hypothetical protein
MDFNCVGECAAVIRIKRISVTDYRDLDSATVAARSGRLQQLLVHASPSSRLLFAEGRPAEQAGMVDWYSSAGGQPVALSQLGDADIDATRNKLNRGLDEVLRVAGSLEASSPDDAAFLRSIARYPSEDDVFVLNGQPVIIAWGYSLAGRQQIGPVPATAAASTVVAETAIDRRGSARRLAIASLALLLLLAGVAAWYLLVYEDPFDKLVARVAAADCDELATITQDPLLNPPDDARAEAREGRFTALRQRAESRILDCRYESQKQLLESTAGDCTALTRIASEGLIPGSSDPRFQQLRTDLEGQMRDCQFQAMKEKVESGTCAEVEKLLKEAQQGADSNSGFAKLRSALQARASRCRREMLSSSDNKCAIEYRKWKNRSGYGAWYQGPEASYCGYSWDFQNLTTAKSRALSECKSVAEGNPCILIGTLN